MICLCYIRNVLFRKLPAGAVDGLIDTAFFEKMSNQWREEQDRCQREIARHLDADRSYLTEGVALLDLARNAQRLFAKARTARETPTAQLSAIELHMGRWRTDRHVSPTF